jgi:type II secretory pathway pseudopilin PulG
VHTSNNQLDQSRQEAASFSVRTVEGKRRWGEEVQEERGRTFWGLIWFFPAPPALPLYLKRKPTRSGNEKKRAQGGRHHRAFTIIELLVVIGIIILLATFLFAAYQHVVTQRKVSDTKTAMESLKALLGNYEEATHYQRPLPIVYTANGAATWNTAIAGYSTTNLVQLWTDGFTGSGEPAASNVSAGALSSSNYPTQLSDTICVMYALEQNSENATIIGNLPTNLKQTIQVSFTAPVQGTALQNPQPVTLILDGWGNPILFAPADGLYGVMTSADATFNASTTYNQGNSVVYQASSPGASYIYTFVGAVSASGAPPASPPTAYTFPNLNWGGLCDPNSLRPYWVSGGPDGDISNTRGDAAGTNTSIKHDDDNVYSFSN